MRSRLKRFPKEQSYRSWSNQNQDKQENNSYRRIYTSRIGVYIMRSNTVYIVYILIQKKYTENKKRNLSFLFKFLPR